MLHKETRYAYFSLASEWYVWTTIGLGAQDTNCNFAKIQFLLLWCYDVLEGLVCPHDSSGAKHFVPPMSIITCHASTHNIKIKMCGQKCKIGSEFVRIKKQQKIKYFFKNLTCLAILAWGKLSRISMSYFFLQWLTNAKMVKKPWKWETFYPQKYIIEKISQSYQKILLLPPTELSNQVISKNKQGKKYQEIINTHRHKNDKQLL